MAHVIPVVSAKILVFSDCRSCQTPGERPRRPGRLPAPGLPRHPR